LSPLHPIRAAEEEASAGKNDDVDAVNDEKFGGRADEFN